MQTDRIEKKVLLRAPRAVVWRAITDSSQFGLWFGVSVHGPFVAGERVAGHIVPTTVDPEVAKMQEPWTGAPCDFHVERIEPMTCFSFRWHPGGDMPGPETPDEQMTTVAFELEDAPGGTLLTITETGFDRVPLQRRAKAFTDNDGGWDMQVQLITRFLARHAAG